MWPPEEHISASLGKSSELRGVLRVRWARVDDVKKRNARRESEFYRKHNKDDRRAPVADDGEGPAKRRRQDDAPPKLTREDLDQELDNFLEQAEDEEEDVPVSKMYADRIEAEEKPSLLQRTSVMRLHTDEFGRDSRRRGPERERRPRGGHGRREREGAAPVARRGERRPEPQRTEPRPHKTQQELDDELDAFLNERA